jgi:hypothetical protein
MNIRKKPQKRQIATNPVAKHLEELNRPKTHRDRTKYDRRDKGFRKEAFFVSAA